MESTVGNYAVRTRSWMSSRDKESREESERSGRVISNTGSAVNTGRRRRQAPTILHPIFEECAALTDDPFWVELFTKAAQGKFKRGFSFKEGHLNYRGKSKLFLGNDPVAAYTGVVQFFREQAGIASTLDREIERKEVEDATAEVGLEGRRWADIKRPRMQELLISDYIRRLGEQHNLNHKEQRQLEGTVTSGKVMQLISGEEIEFSDGIVRSISGLLFDEESRLFSIHSDKVGKAVRKGRSGRGKEIKSIVMRNWETLMKGMERRVVSDTAPASG